MPVRLQHLQYGNTVWLIWRRSGRWWLEHDWPGTTGAYPSSFFPFHRGRRRKKKPLLCYSALTSRQTTTWNLWITRPAGAKIISRTCRVPRKPARILVPCHAGVSSKKEVQEGARPLELTSDSNLYSWRQDSDDGSPTGSSRARNTLLKESTFKSYSELHPTYKLRYFKRSQQKFPPKMCITTCAVGTHWAPRILQNGLPLNLIIGDICWGICTEVCLKGYSFGSNRTINFRCVSRGVNAAYLTKYLFIPSTLSLKLNWKTEILFKFR